MTRRKKEEDQERQEQTHHRKIVDQERKRKQENVVVEEWYEIKAQKVLHTKKVKNGNVYSVFVCNNNPKYKDEIMALVAQDKIRVVDRTGVYVK